MDSALKVVVEVSTQTDERIIQQVVGRKSWMADVEEFRGIPYADVSTRWTHSTVRRNLPSDQFDATKNGPRCPQPQGPNHSDSFRSHLDFPELTEDEFACLNLFIIRPSAEALERLGLTIGVSKLPVYFYIHGGGYGFGSGTDPMWDPTRLVARSIALGQPFIAVNINYRLNLFGFAASPLLIEAQQAHEVRGCNFGLVDQRNALDWVVANISSFGGDPDAITIGGQSAGASSVHAHVLDATAVGSAPLFRRAIMESGAVGTLGPNSLESAAGNFDRVVEALELSGLDDNEKVARLRSLPVSQLLETGMNLGWWVFPLTLDGYTIRTSETRRWEIFLGQGHPAPSCSQSTKPLMVMAGDCDTEASIWDAEVSKVQSFSVLHSIPQSCLDKAAVADFLDAYSISESMSLTSLQERITQFLTDFAFGYPVHAARTELREQPDCHYSTSVQAFRVRYTNPFDDPSIAVAHHCVELIYVFDAFHDALRQADQKHGSKTNEALVDATQRQWIAFINARDDEELSSDQIAVWGKDRVKTIETMHDQEAAARGKRFQTLERLGLQAGILFSKLTSIEVDRK